MVKPIVAIGSVIFGGSTVGVVLHVQNQGRDTPASVPQREIAAARAAEKLPMPVEHAVISEPEPITVEAVTVYGQRLPKVRRVTRRPQALAEPILEPCSDWRELGPNSGVRELCPREDRTR